MDMEILPAVVIVLATVVVDRTRAYRAIPVMVNRLRRRRLHGR
jgi:hypothetical protein